MKYFSTELSSIHISHLTFSGMNIDIQILLGGSYINIDKVVSMMSYNGKMDWEGLHNCLSGMFEIYDSIIHIDYNFIVLDLVTGSSVNYLGEEIMFLIEQFKGFKAATELREIHISDNLAFAINACAPTDMSCT